MKTTVKILAFAVLVLGAVFVGYLFWFFPNHGIILVPKGETPDMALTGEIGDFIAGVLGTAFSFAATLLVVVTLLEQNRQNQRNLFVQSYYEMLHVHSDNVRQMTLHVSPNVVYRGREVFSQLIKNYNTIYDTVERYIQHIINGGLRGQSLEKEQIDYLSDSIKREKLTMRLAYGYFFYGSESYKLQSCNEDAIEKTIEESVLSIGRTNQFYTEGCHVVLGHYFRHMFQMIQYVINATFLSEEERYIFAKQLRAQMDDEEQLLLYYNAMSDVGKEWLKTDVEDATPSNSEQLCLVARFRMIKNIPAFIKVKGVKPEFEFGSEITFYQKKKKSFFEQR